MLYHLALLPNIGPTELIIALVVVLLIFGPKNIPKLASLLGRGVREFKDASTKMTESWTDDDGEDEKKERRRSASREKEDSEKESRREAEPREELIGERPKEDPSSASPSRDREKVS